MSKSDLLAGMVPAGRIAGCRVCEAFGLTFAHVCSKPENVVREDQGFARFHGAACPGRMSNVTLEPECDGAVTWEWAGNGPERFPTGTCREAYGDFKAWGGVRDGDMVASVAAWLRDRAAGRWPVPVGTHTEVGPVMVSQQALAQEASRWRCAACGKPSGGGTVTLYRYEDGSEVHESCRAAAAPKSAGYSLKGSAASVTTDISTERATVKMHQVLGEPPLQGRFHSLDCSEAGKSPVIEKVHPCSYMVTGHYMDPRDEVGGYRPCQIIREIHAEPQKAIERYKRTVEFLKEKATRFVPPEGPKPLSESERGLLKALGLPAPEGPLLSPWVCRCGRKGYYTDETMAKAVCGPCGVVLVESGAVGTLPPHQRPVSKTAEGAQVNATSSLSAGRCSTCGGIWDGLRRECQAQRCWRAREVRGM